MLAAFRGLELQRHSPIEQRLRYLERHLGLYFSGIFLDDRGKVICVGCAGLVLDRIQVALYQLSREPVEVVEEEVRIP